MNWSKKLAQGFNTAAQESNPGSRRRVSEALPLSHCALSVCSMIYFIVLMICKLRCLRKLHPVLFQCVEVWSHASDTGYHLCCFSVWKCGLTPQTLALICVVSVCGSVVSRLRLWLSSVLFQCVEVWSHASDTGYHLCCFSVWKCGLTPQTLAIICVVSVCGSVVSRLRYWLSSVLFQCVEVWSHASDTGYHLCCFSVWKCGLTPQTLAIICVVSVCGSVVSRLRHWLSSVLFQCVEVWSHASDSGYHRSCNYSRVSANKQIRVSHIYIYIYINPTLFSVKTVTSHLVPTYLTLIAQVGS